MSLFLYTVIILVAIVGSRVVAVTAIVAIIALSAIAIFSIAVAAIFSIPAGIKRPEKSVPLGTRH